MKYKADTSIPKPMEVWNAKVDFDGSMGAKNRPAIVLDKKGDDYIVFMVTSHGHQPETDIKLVDPYEVMLDRTSTVRTDRTFTIPRTRFNYKLGDLCPDDCEMIEMFYGRVRNGKRIKSTYVRSRVQSYDLSHVNKVIRHPFGIRGHRKELGTDIQCAYSLVEPGDMVLGHLLRYDIHMLLDVVRLFEGGLAGLGVSYFDLVVKLFDERLHLHGLLYGDIGESAACLVKPLCVFHDVLRIITDTLEVRNGMIHGGDVDLIPLR